MQKYEPYPNIIQLDPFAVGHVSGFIGVWKSDLIGFMLNQGHVHGQNVWLFWSK